MLGIVIEDKYQKNLPQWDSFDKKANSIISRLFWIIVYTIVYYKLSMENNIHGFGWIMIGILLIATSLMAPMHGAIINWWGHIYGYHNHDLDNTSTNISFGKPKEIIVFIIKEGDSQSNIIIKQMINKFINITIKKLKVLGAIIMNFLMMGEDCHNNHHAKQ